MTSDTGHDRDAARRREARETLDRLERDVGPFASSALGRVARRTAAHFSARDAVGAGEHGTTDPIEVWGRRIGRALGLIAVVGLAIYFYLTYLR